MARVLIGASVAPGLHGVETFRALKLGDCVLAALPLDKAEALSVALYCREHRIRLYFSEILYRGSTDTGKMAGRRIPREEFYGKEDLREIVEAAGDYYGGRMSIGEAGGILYWPKAYLLDARAFANLTPVERVDDARDAYLRYLERYLQYERQELGAGPLLNVDSSLVFKFHAEAGIDVLCHEMLPGDPHRMQAAIRGAARAYARPWGTHIAMGWYGGVALDALWLKRWKSSVYYSYLTGAEFIWPESGHLALTCHQTGRTFAFDSTEMKESRRILREAYQFSHTHTRPANGPRAVIGVVYGHCDGAPGLWNPYAWGQFHDRKWLAGPPEKGWELLDGFHRKEEWSNACVQGETDFSGTPPYGQYDIVPVEADLAVLSRYPCLVFLGWNTMTEAIYEKLKAYVAAGGHLVMYLAHLNTETDRAAEPRLFRDGDFRDLFGVHIAGKGETDVRGVKYPAQSILANYRFPVSQPNLDPRFLGEFTPAQVEVTTARVLAAHDGNFAADPQELRARPVLVENRLGEGVAMLATVWEYPAHDGIVAFTRDLLRTVLAGEQGEIRLLSTDRVRYAVYDGTAPGSGRPFSVVYLLNTDPDCPALARLWIEEQTTEPFLLPANEMRLAYRLGDLVLLPEERHVDLKCWDEGEVALYSLHEQPITVCNLGAAETRISVNGRHLSLAPRASRTVSIAACPHPNRACFYAPNFLEEPPLEGVDTHTPY